MIHVIATVMNCTLVEITTHREYEYLHGIEKVHSQIEFSIIKGSYNYVDLTS